MSYATSRAGRWSLAISFFALAALTAAGAVQGARYSIAATTRDTRGAVAAADAPRLAIATATTPVSSTHGSAFPADADTPFGPHHTGGPIVVRARR